MIKNILLVSCRSPFLDDSKIYPPLGIMYLKSYLNLHYPTINVDLWDEYEMDDFKHVLKYDLVGLSVMTPQKDEALQILQTIHYYCPNVKVAIGGPHAKHYHKEVVNESWDYVVIGDGEPAFDDIINDKHGKSSNYQLNLVQFKQLPPPDRTSDQAKKMLAKYKYVLQGRQSTTMMTARGCPYQCTFCEDATTLVRMTPLDNLKKQLDDIKNLGYGGVYIFDDTFAINPNSVLTVVKELKSRDLIFRCNGQARSFTKDGELMAKILGEHGCVEIAFGFESGSQKILDNIRKFTTVADNYASAKYAKKYGIYVKAFIMLGLPGEDWDTLKATEEFMDNADCDDYQFAVYMPYKGTKIRDDIDNGVSIDLMMTVPEVSGAYGIKGGETVYEVRTTALSAEDLQKVRNRWVEKYKPRSHKPKWIINS